MKILLILPAGDQFRVPTPSSPIPRRKMLRFSLLPLTTVAALTPKDCEVKIVDENVEFLDFDDPADLVGITFMTALAPRAYQIAHEFKMRGVPVVAGGYHPTFCPEEVAMHFDSVVIGEAEGNWERVVEDARSGKLKKFYRQSGPCDPAAIPIPRRELTASTAGQYVTVNALQTGRGCKNSCRYCSITTFHKHQHRSRPMEMVLDELRQLPRDIMFIDDNLIADREFITKLLREIIPMKKRWVTQCSIDVADSPELLDLMKRAGCIGLFIGIESLSAKNMAEFDKPFNLPSRYKARIAKIHVAGINVFASIIVGGDNDDISVFNRMLHFLQEVHADGLQLNIMTPLPGTPLFETMNRDGRVTDYDWSKYDFRHVVMQPKLMSRLGLQDGADGLYLAFYRLDRVVLRALRTLWRSGWVEAWVVLMLNMTYRYDNRREGLAKRLKGGVSDG